MKSPFCAPAGFAAMQKLWSDLAWEQLQDWTTRDKKTLKRIYALIQSIDRNGVKRVGPQWWGSYQPSGVKRVGPQWWGSSGGVRGQPSRKARPGL